MISYGSEVGIPDLEEHLRDYIERVRGGEELVVTDGGRPVARLSPIDGRRDRLAELVAAGVVRPPIRKARAQRGHRIEATGPVSDLVTEQRR
jgi:prevent-host-death family protein